MKLKGNDHFRASKWVEALESYKLALRHVPKRPKGPETVLSTAFDDVGKQKEVKPGISDLPVAGESSTEETPEKIVTELDRECSMARSVLNGNIAASLAHMVSNVMCSPSPTVPKNTRSLGTT